ncbi:GH12 family glycosyl hydrolase domain-containing protein [Actinomycetospora atypica]|uniref:Glycosyl hydrolase family 12 n=1 Tax=Actinomycetospora atypica TaxID=1290095 RepID=A0ABV9YT65_9PSEU
MGPSVSAGQAAGSSGAQRPGRHRARRPLVVVALVAALAAGLGALIVGPTMGSAAAPRRTCEQFGSMGVSGDKYVIQNSRWGASTAQCITENGPTGFIVDTAEHTNNQGPAGYPSIYRGCNYGYCTKDSPFPAMVSQLGTVRSSWDTSGPTAVPAAVPATTTTKAATTTKAPAGTTTAPGATPTTAPAATTTAAPASRVQQYNTAYDVWFHPTKDYAGRPAGAEMMIWLNRTSWVQPIGKPYYDVTIAGTKWTVWYGAANPPVISYVRKTPVTSVKDLPIEAFTRDAMLRGVVKPTWYMQSVQAGFEPWTGGTGLTTKSFSVTRNGK